MRLSEQIFPRSVVLISTISKDGRPNLMTASFVMPVSFEPKFVAFSISHKRHSFKNLEEVPEFTMNVLESSQAEASINCGTSSGQDTEKFRIFGITPIKSKRVRPPVIDCPISFECKVAGIHEYGDHFIMVGEVVSEWVRKSEFIPLLHKGGASYMTPRPLE